MAQLQVVPVSHRRYQHCPAGQIPAAPCRTPWYSRPAVLLALVLGTQALLAPSAGAASLVPISCSGHAVSENPYWANGITTTFMAIPSGPVLHGTPVILVAQVTPAHAAGAVQFKDGESELGPLRAVIGGFALTVTSKLTEGTHLLTAVFTAANGAVSGPSAQPSVLLTVIGSS